MCAGLLALLHGPFAVAQEQTAPVAQSAKAKALKPAKPASAAWAALLPRYEAELKVEPQSALKLFRSFVADNPDLDADELISAYEDAATRLARLGGAQFDAAIALLEEGKPRVAEDNRWPRLVALQAELLLKGGRAGQAEPLVAAVWPKALESGTSKLWRRELMREYVEVLSKREKPDQAESVLMETLAKYPDLLDGMGNYFCAAMLRLKEQQKDRAGQLTWAAAAFRLWPFDEKALAFSTDKLTKLWIKDDMTLNAARAFAVAQTDVKAPNPLDDVALPLWPAPVQSALLRSTQDGPFNGRIKAYLALGRYSEAMLLAREQLISKPTSPDSLKQVARVFKAADGDVARSNAFIAYYNSGQGENPMIAFLAEN